MAILSPMQGAHGWRYWIRHFTEASGTSQKSQFKTEVVDFFYFGQEVAVCLLGQQAKGGAGGDRVSVVAAH